MQERTLSLVNAGIDWMNQGGFCDFTAGKQVRTLACPPTSAQSGACLTHFML
jgi:hypothetical protein